MTCAVLTPALLLVLASTLAAQQPAPGPAPVFRSSANLVPLSVTVTDANKHFVLGLTAADFTVFEDGVQQRVQFFESTEIPLDLILLLDASSSMSGRMPIVHEAAVGFLRTLRDGDRGAVVAFADGVDIRQALTGDRQALEDAVHGTVAKGATAFHNALYISLKQFGRRARQDGAVRRQAIAVLTDGEDTSSLVTFDDVLSMAQQSGVGIYPIALQSRYAAGRLASAGQRRHYSGSEYSLRRLAQETGTQAFFPLEATELKSVYAAIAQELSSQYSLAYAPTNGRTDGRYRRIVVRVADRPELRLRTRTGYSVELGRSASASTVLRER